MGKKTEEWLAPWSQAFASHSQPIREAKRSKDAQKLQFAIQEHLPAMLEIRDEVAGLPLPYGYEPGIFGKVLQLATGLNTAKRLEITREASLQVWNESIGDAQRELRKLEQSRR